MNKLILIPMMVLILCTVVSFITGGNVVGPGFNVDDPSSSTIINGSTTTFESSNGGIFNFNLFSGDGLLLVIIALAAIGIVAGISLFGSGLSEFSQNIIVKSVGFLGLWAALVLFSKDIIMTGTGIFGILVYFALTIC